MNAKSKFLISSLLFAASLPVMAANMSININTANAEQLSELSGIGPSKANAIIAYRKAHGPFKDISEITKVKGIGPKLLEHDKAQLALK